MDEARELDLHYIPARYPNGLPGGFPHSFYGIETAKRAIESVRKIINVIDDYYKSQGFEVPLGKDEA